MPKETDHKNELAKFLRTRRQQVSPAEVGLPHVGRRRTPGLRREEVAVLAGVSTTWYTYLEQGRNKDVSPAVLNSIARVLQLSEDERRHMHFLAYGQIIGPQPLEGDPPVTDLLAKVVDIASDHPYPVYMLDHLTNLIAWNKSAAEWYEDWTRLPPRDRNFVRWMFISPRARESLVDWEVVTRDVVARWRAEIARWPGDKMVGQQIADLTKTSPEFAHCWAHYEVLEHRTTLRRLHHPRLGVHTLRILPVCSYYVSMPGVFFHFPA